jgi:hypothetical protein
MRRFLFLALFITLALGQSKCKHLINNIHAYCLHQYLIRVLTKFFYQALTWSPAGKLLMH